MLLQQHHVLLKLNFCPLHDLVSLIALLLLIFSLVIGLFLYHNENRQPRRKIQHASVSPLFAGISEGSVSIF